MLSDAAPSPRPKRAQLWARLTPVALPFRLRRGASCDVLDTVPLWGRGKEGVFLTAAARQAVRKMWKTATAAILSRGVSCYRFRNPASNDKQPHHVHHRNGSQGGRKSQVHHLQGHQ